jgi:NitT/TauT family transport system ATP-binding protein
MSSPASQNKRGNITAVTVDHVSKQFPVPGGELLVLDDISLEVRAGEILAILGKSGSGKTTLLNIVSGLEAPSTGNVLIQGSVGYVPQKDLLLPWRTVIENIVLPAEIQNADPGISVAKARHLLAQNGLADCEKLYPSELSGGMRQKVSLMRTLLQDPDIVLFDEPFSAIDMDARLQLVVSIRLYIASSKKVAMFVTHSIEEAIAVADTLVVLSEKPARMVYQTNIAIPDIYRDPVNVRKSADFQHVFDRIWDVMGTHA